MGVEDLLVPAVGQLQESQSKFHRESPQVQPVPGLQVGPTPIAAASLGVVAKPE